MRGKERWSAAYRFNPLPGMGAAEVMRKVRGGYRMDKPDLWAAGRSQANRNCHSSGHRPDLLTLTTSGVSLSFIIEMLLQDQTQLRLMLLPMSPDLIGQWEVIYLLTSAPPVMGTDEVHVSPYQLTSQFGPPPSGPDRSSA
ncbi:hypothetical protein GWK47_037594 [Chionoecetes opilio]|uniref:Uncharacterized protein n=1 Tax=Chionoecetes opilio TaxID=41210 RepID=A0A8J4YSG7_CHIOP|nr:hypothetical protein GWK47_037594 [Chionoecetes opilio]